MSQAVTGRHRVKALSCPNCGRALPVPVSEAQIRCKCGKWHQFTKGQIEAKQGKTRPNHL